MKSTVLKILALAAMMIQAAGFVAYSQTGKHDDVTELGRNLLLVRDYNGNQEYEFHHGFVPTMANGVVTKSGKVILPQVFQANKYEYAVKLVVNTLWARKDGLWGAYTLQGKLIVPHKYKDIMPSEFDQLPENLVQATEENGRTTIYDKNGRDIGGATFKRVSNSKTGQGCQVVKLYNSGKMGIMRLDGTYAVQPQYEDIEINHRCPYAVVKKNGKYGIITFNGKVKIPFKYDELSYDWFGSDGDNYLFDAYIGKKKETISLK